VVEAVPEPDYAAELAGIEAELLARWPESKLAPSLDRIAALVEWLGHPQRTYPVIHLTGTNGKTSTTRMIDTLLREFGLRTGRFTSPHLEHMRERISLSGEAISAERFVQTYRELVPYFELVDAKSDIPLSFFEVMVGMAYAAFAEAPVDVAVVEVGLGGTWDATNVADGQVAVVTPIALDHTKYLGDTPELIAGEKAGIVKPGAFVVMAAQPLEVATVLLRRAGEVDATVAREGLEFGVRGRTPAVGGQLLEVAGLAGTYDELFLPLLGAHQAHNAAVALAAVDAFLGGARGALDADVVRSAFAKMTSPGRLEVVRRGPTIILDAAHNPAGARATAEAVAEAFTFDNLVGVVGVMADKDARGVLEALEPVLAEVVITEAATERAMDADALAAIAVDVFGGHRVEVVKRLDDALDAAVATAEAGGDLLGAGVLVAGSVILAGQARTLLGPRGMSTGEGGGSG
jgi:dihydrofolate synthase / folylpolyglutamate synthase